MPVTDGKPVEPEARSKSVLAELVNEGREQPATLAATFDACARAAEGNEVAVASISANPVPTEVRTNAVYVSIDDVLVKRQSDLRGGIKTKRKRRERAKHLPHTVVHMEADGKVFNLCARNVSEALVRLAAVLATNRLDRRRLVFIIDGCRRLRGAVLEHFSWHPAVTVILDWYHLHAKCVTRIASLLRARNDRDAAIEHLDFLLWHGLVDQACQWLRSLDKKIVRNVLVVDKLAQYFERNRPYIPCYAARRQLGLRLSSSVCEKANDLIVAKRQKHNGMSWTAEGSHALAGLTTLRLNNQVETWLQCGSVQLDFLAAA